MPEHVKDQWCCIGSFRGFQCYICESGDPSFPFLTQFWWRLKGNGVHDINDCSVRAMALGVTIKNSYAIHWKKMDDMVAFFERAFVVSRMLEDKKPIEEIKLYACRE